MNELFALEIGRNALLMTVMLAAPMMGAALVVGLVISVFQALTQINHILRQHRTPLRERSIEIAMQVLWRTSPLAPPLHRHRKALQQHPNHQVPAIDQHEQHQLEGQRNHHRRQHHHAHRHQGA